MITRRHLLRTAPLVLGAPSLALSRPLQAKTGSDERQFLFIFCSGGWDPFAVFAPLFDSKLVDLEPKAESGLIGGIPFVDHPDRPSVRSFFSDYGSRCCVLNGFEVPSIAHERCIRLLLTASSSQEADDWATIMAGRSSRDLLLPHLVLSGPAFANQYASKVVRVGKAGQMPALLDGSAFSMSDTAFDPLSAPAESLADAWVRSRSEAHLATASAGWQARIAEAYQAGNTQLQELQEYASVLGFGGTNEHDLIERLELALDCLEQGLSRSVTVQYEGVWQVGWDTHSDNWYQSLHFEELFGYLSRLAADLDSRTAIDGRPLSEKLTVVVLSEMGRDPRMNEWDGRHHWTTTSALIFGAGVRGDQVVGAWADTGLGKPVDLETGLARDDGEHLSAAHLGATLLALAEVDPEEYPEGVEPIAAILE